MAQSANVQMIFMLAYAISEFWSNIPSTEYRATYSGMFTGKQLDTMCIVPILFSLTEELLADRVTTAPVNEVSEGQVSVRAGKDFNVRHHIGEAVWDFFSWIWNQPILCPLKLSITLHLCFAFKGKETSRNHKRISFQSGYQLCCVCNFTFLLNINNGQITKFWGVLWVAADWKVWRDVWRKMWKLWAMS